MYTGSSFRAAQKRQIADLEAYGVFAVVLIHQVVQVNVVKKGRIILQQRIHEFSHQRLYLTGVHLVALYGQQLGLTPAGPPKRERHLRAGSAQSPITRM